MLINLKDIKNEIVKRENLFYLIVIFIIFLLDRFSKIQIINSTSENILYINDYVNFNLVWNTGIGFGLLSSSSTLIYNLITILIGIVILSLFYVVLKADKYESLIFSVIIGGALGNFYDRLTLSAVPDFIDLHFNDFHWFTFNIADIFITIGIIAFLLKGFFIKYEK